MQVHKRRARRLALAFAVPAVALGAIALSATSASSSATQSVGVRATDAPAPGGGGTTGGGGGATTGGGGTASKIITKTATKTATATKTPTKTPTATKTPSKSASASASASGSGGASGGAGGPGGVVVPLPSNAGCGLSPTPPITVQVGQAGGKQALVDGNGCSLYLNTQDTAGQSACDATCQATWVPVPGPATAGSGLDQTNFSTFTRADGSTQATYVGHQLYWYTGDTAAGQANGQAMNQIWYLLDQSGNPITS